MCGIAGLIGTDRPIEAVETAVARMNSAMVHRGPDGGGWVRCGSGALGMRRLAIFDPANGHQPMRTPDGRYTIVFNGAVYNFRALRTTLQARGHSFHTECDTEVLLHGYAEWGAEILDRLRGMFAFAVWDERERSLFLARDPFGIKPLYLHPSADGGIAFASELNALLASGCVPAEIDPRAASAYLSWLSVPAPQTPYRNITSLEPGECASWRDGRLTRRSYRHLNELAIGNPQPCRTRAEFNGALRAQLEDTIRAHLAADVPVGAFLSGGLDSTAIVALMTRVGGARLKTFSIGFDTPDFSETSEAEANARHLGTEHQTTVLTGRRVADEIGAIIAGLDHPTGDGINTWYASQAARAGGVTVALSGLGDDELFGGYPSFRNVPMLTRWLRLWRALPAPLGGALLMRWDRGDARSRKLAETLRHAHSPAALALLQRRVFATHAVKSLLSSDVAYEAHPAERQLIAELADSNSFDLVSTAEMRGYMADVLLRDSDVMSMRHSLELRVPFVDRPLVTWLANQPARFRNTPDRPKSALADAVHDLLPPGLARRPKRGFTLPLAVWMRSELRPFLEDTFSTASAGRSGLFNPPAVQVCWQQFISSKDPRQWSRVWSLAMLIAFVNRPSPVTR